MPRPWLTVEQSRTHDGLLELRSRGDRDWLITLDGRVLMSSGAHRSEDALARLALDPKKTPARARVLVSGLGMGFTLRAALDALGPQAHVVVAELNPVVVAWCRGALASLTGNALADPRVDLRIADVSHVIAGAVPRERGGTRPKEPVFDAIVLDLYAGPPSSVDPRDALYGGAATRRTASALATGGTLAVWCENPSPGYERNLRAADLAFERHRAGRGGSVHLVYVARAARASAPSHRRARPA